jgi:hypothetical protein
MSDTPKFSPEQIQLIQSVLGQLAPEKNSSNQGVSTVQFVWKVVLSWSALLRGGLRSDRLFLLPCPAHITQRA